MESLFKPNIHGIASRKLSNRIKGLIESLAGADDETFGFGNRTETLFNDLPRYTSCGSEITHQRMLEFSPKTEPCLMRV